MDYYTKVLSIHTGSNPLLTSGPMLRLDSPWLTVRSESETLFQDRVSLVSNALGISMRSKVLRDKVIRKYRRHYKICTQQDKNLLPKPKYFHTSDLPNIEHFIKQKAEDYKYRLRRFSGAVILNYVTGYRSALVESMNNILNTTAITFDHATVFYRPCVDSPMSESHVFTYADYARVYHLKDGEPNWRHDDLASACAQMLLRTLYPPDGNEPTQMDVMVSKGSVFLCMMCAQGTRIKRTWVDLVGIHSPFTYPCYASGLIMLRFVDKVAHVVAEVRYYDLWKDRYVIQLNSYSIGTCSVTS